MVIVVVHHIPAVVVHFQCGAIPDLHFRKGRNQAEDYQFHPCCFVDEDQAHPLQHHVHHLYWINSSMTWKKKHEDYKVFMSWR